MPTGDAFFGQEFFEQAEALGDLSTPAYGKASLTCGESEPPGSARYSRSIGRRARCLGNARRADRYGLATVRKQCGWPLMASAAAVAGHRA